MRRALFLLLALLPLAPTGAGAQNPLDALRLQDMKATRERPLFAPSRRPPPPVQVEALPAPPAPVKDEAAESAPPPFDLIGAVVGGGTAFALLRNRASNEVVKLRPGEEAAGWRVGVVGIRSVALERDGRKELLSFAAPRPLPAAADVPGAQDQDESAAAAPVAQLNHVVGHLSRDR